MKKLTAFFILVTSACIFSLNLFSQEPTQIPDWVRKRLNAGQYAKLEEFVKNFQNYAMMVKTVQKHSRRMRTIFSAFPIV